MKSIGQTAAENPYFPQGLNRIVCRTGKIHHLLKRQGFEFPNIQLFLNSPQLSPGSGVYVDQPADPKKIEIPANERISPVRLEDLRRKAPGNVHCKKCGSDRIHISYGGAQNMPLLLRIFFVVYRCHTCGSLLRYARPMHWVRRIFGSARQASIQVLDREPMIDSQASEFKAAKRDKNPVFREAKEAPAVENIEIAIDPYFDPDRIVKQIKSNYTASQRELMASKFQEIAILIQPPASAAEPQNQETPEIDPEK